MPARLSHLQLNIRAEHLPFYSDLLGFLGWVTVYADETMLGVGDGGGTSLWFIGQARPVANDYDGPGMNHLGLGVDSIAAVDATVAYLSERGVARLFETPRHRPEFAAEGQTYYQVMFETPDRLLLEVVYQGPAN
jgi:catechol 2,3-dioxygenase-like lactoylglutathione lyase family enzyme